MCNDVKCTATQPDYLNLAKVDSAWNLINSVVPAIGGKSSINFEVCFALASRSLLQFDL